MTRGTCVAPRGDMSTRFNFAASCFALTVMVACGPGQESKTVTNSDSTTTHRNGGTTETTTQDTQVVSTDGSKDSTHVEEVKQQPAP
jgi:hypothetical protein